MKAFFEVFKLEITGFVRSRALALIAVASVAWMFVAPHVFRGDGTGEGAREMCVRFSLGGVAALLSVSLLIASAGSLSRERVKRRLQLTMVRPIRLFALVLGKIVAISTVGAGILALATGIEIVRQDGSRRCSSVHRPVLPSPAQEAEAMYASYMADPETPPEIKKSKKSVVLRLLTQKALDHYQTIGTNETATWRFPILSVIEPTASLALRFRFTNAYNMRDEVNGRVSADGYSAVVSNITQAIVRMPLVATGAASGVGERRSDLSFSNHGSRTVMLRPRKDVELLVGADGFRANLARAYLQLVGMLTLLVAFGVFLGAGLSRPVAVFTAVVSLALCEMSPSVIEQYPDQLEVSRVDAIGLSIARFAATVTHPIGSLRPLAAVANDERIEPQNLFRTMLADIVLIPILFSLLAAFIIPRKQDEM